MSRVTLKCSDLIRQYDGTGDFSEWVQKLELVASLQQIDKLHTFLPLFLTGGAFSVYQSLTAETKGDYDGVKRALTSAFSLNPFKAYEEFTSRRLMMGESVDVFLADLARLARLVTDSNTDGWLKCAFVNGLPEEAKAQLQAACSLSDMSLSDVVEKARNLVATREACLVSFRSKRGERAAPTGKVGAAMCFRCGENGHISRYCPKRAGVGGDGGALRSCFVCGERGHLAAACPKRKSESSKNE